jgi:hypothetical protein
MSFKWVQVDSHKRQWYLVNLWDFSFCEEESVQCTAGTKMGGIDSWKDCFPSFLLSCSQDGSREGEGGALVNTGSIPFILPAFVGSFYLQNRF